MLVLEFKAYGKLKQFRAIDAAIRVTQFIRNKALRLWMDGLARSCFDLNKYCAVLAKEFDFAHRLNSQARQSAAERAWAAITRFYENCKQQIPGKKGFPQFQKHCRSVEYKTSGWKLAENRKAITFTDQCGIGKVKLKGTRDLHCYQPDQIKRVRLVKRADGYYVQFCLQVNRMEEVKPSGRAIGLDVGLHYFYTDSNHQTVDNPRFLPKGVRRLRQAQKRVSRRVKGSQNRAKARVILSKCHLKISRQRKDHAVKLARSVITSNDVVVYEDLRISNRVQNHGLAKSINDASWQQFRVWLEYFGQVFGKITIAVPAAGASQECSACGTVVKKSWSTRTHVCQCGYALGRDHHAARTILRRGLGTVGHTGTFMLDMSNA